MNRAGMLLLICFSMVAVRAVPAEQATYYVQVIWGTDQNRPPGTKSATKTAENHREIGPKLSAKLSPVFRWKHYWETERCTVQLSPAKVTKVSLANNRTLEIERLKSGEMEVRLYRRSGLVTKTRQPRNGCMAILGGEDSRRDSFFVVVRPDEPVNGN